MKVGILTMNYNNCNYGGILQCVALRKTLECMGYDVEVIRFSAKDKDKISRKIKLILFGMPIDVVWEYIYNLGMDIFERFWGKQMPLSQQLLDKCRFFIDENIRYTELCNEDTIGELVRDHNLDIIVIGSDKIWGELARNKLVYLGDFKPQFEGKIVTYAACSSFPFIPKYNKDRIHDLLRNLYAVSVRDTYTRDLFKCYPDIKMEIVLDPTFLYDFIPYLKKTDTDPYILAYILGRKINGGHEEIFKSIKCKYGNMKIKAIILSNESTNIVPYVDEVIDDADPSNWINMIYNASFVYTDSFHGAVFSLKFEKPFIAYYTELSRATRLIDLRDRLQLDKVIISSVKDFVSKKTIDYDIDYNLVNEMLSKMQAFSLDFLRKAFI